MPREQHIFLRGSVWQWRRRISGLSTGSYVLQVSLRTTNRRFAVKLAREMTVECDRMLDESDIPNLDPKMLNVWAKQVFLQKLEKLSHSRLVARNDPGSDPDDEALWDGAAQTAWALLDGQGINAKLPANPEISKSFVEENAINVMLESLRADLASEGRRNCNAGSFERLTGQTVTTCVQFIQLQQAYIRAIAHAQKSVSQLDQDRKQSMLGLLDEALEELRAPHPHSFTTQGNMASEPETSSQEQTVANGALLPLERADHSNPPHETETLDPSMTAVVSRLMDEKRAEKLRDDTAKQYGSCIDLFLKITGITDVRAVNQAAASQFKRGLQRIAKSHGKSPSDRNMSFPDMLAKASRLPTDKVGLSAPTINRHLDHLSQVLGQADSEGIPLQFKVNTTKLRMKEKKRDRDKRNAFRQDELRKVFRHTLWTGQRSRARRHEAGSLVVKDGQYWCPLISSVTGARLEEISALMIDDIQTEDGIYFFVFDQNEIRDIKTEASRRRVPIHSALIDAGFLDHVQSMKRRGSRAVFPEMAPGATAKSKYGKKLGYNWRKTLKIILDGNPRLLCFHSLRHFVNNQIRDLNDVPCLVRLNIMGQEADDTNDRVYSEPSELPVLKAVIERLPAYWELTEKKEEEAA